jgi:hypothetical protein
MCEVRLVQKLFYSWENVSFVPVFRPAQGSTSKQLYFHTPVIFMAWYLIQYSDNFNLHTF